jgi:hypothetical protein
LVDFEGKEITDPQAGANAEDDEGAVSQRVSMGQIFFRASFNFFGEDRTTNHVFLLKAAE